PRALLEHRRASRKFPPPEPRILMPVRPVSIGVLEDALFALGEEVIAHGTDAPGGLGPGRFAAARSLLARRPPPSDPSGPELLAGGVAGTHLAVQGPPGSGKTTEGGGMVVDLVPSGRRVGATGPSHPVVGNV